MELINRWVEVENLAEQRKWLLGCLDLFDGDETGGEIGRHFSYQLKQRANGLLNTEQRRKVPGLADSLLLAGILLPGRQGRARGLAQARGLMVRANYFYRNGEYGLALLDYGEAERLCLENGNPIEAIRCKMRLIETLSRLGRQAEAVALVGPTLAQAEAMGD